MKTTKPAGSFHNLPMTLGQVRDTVSVKYCSWRHTAGLDPIVGVYHFSLGRATLSVVGRLV